MFFSVQKLVLVSDRSEGLIFTINKGKNEVKFLLGGTALISSAT